MWISVHINMKKESSWILSFSVVWIIREIYKINFVTFHNGLSGGVNSNDRFLIGCQAAAGIPVSKISEDACVSREWVYQQKDSVLDYIHSLDCQKEPVLSINIDERFIERMVLSLSLDCHASINGIQRTFASVLGTGISAGRISSILADASKRAEVFDNSI